MVKEKATGKYAGYGIADFDTKAKELILEWIDCGEDEIEMGLSEVRETMEHIVYYHSVKDKILKCLNLL